MTTKRIRCGCGRVYDPVKRPACPDCGTVNPIVAAPPEPPPVPNEPSAPSGAAEKRSAPRPIPPRYLAIGAAVLGLLALLMFLGRNKEEKTAAVEIDQATSTPTAAIAPSTPGPSPTAVVHREVPSATPLPSVANVPTPAPTKILVADDDLATLIANATPGATIRVRPGTYTSLTLTRPIKLVGDPAVPVFLKGEGQSALTVQSPGVSLQNIQILTNGIGTLPAVAIAEGAAVEMNAVGIQSNTEIGILVSGKASLKALGTTFAVPNGVGLRLKGPGNAHLTQCSFTDSHVGLNAWGGATVELHSCAFERAGGSNGHGSIIALSGQGTSATVDDCRFQNNGAGLIVSQEAAITITNSSFTQNAASAADGILGLISLRNGGRAVLEHDRFESNRHGIAVMDGSSVEVRQCEFTGNGLDQRQVVPASLPLLVSGEKSRATVRKTTLRDSAQYAIGVMAGGNLTLEDVEVSGSRIAGVILGERNVAPVHAVIRRSRFIGNGTGLGLLAGGSAELEDCEFRENNDGLIVFDPGTQLRATRTAIGPNRERGLYVYLQADARLVDCDLKNNARGAVSGTRGRAAERASIALENCRFGGNRVYGAGASTQSKLSLTNCVFDGTDKTNLYRERGSIIELNEPPTPTPALTETPPVGTEGSPTPEESAEPSVSPAPESSASPSPGRVKVTPRPRRKPTPRPHPPTPEDIRRALRKLLPGS